MKPVPTRTLLAACFALAVAIVLPFQGVSAAAPAVRLAPPLHVLHFNSGPLTKAQILKFAGNADLHVIVVLKNEYSGLSGRARHMMATRDAKIVASQRPVMAELRSVHARHLLAFHIINAIRATVSPAEEAHLKADPAVRAVVPDATIPLPRVHFPEALPGHYAAARPAAAIPSCSSSTTPLLQPDALMVTHTAYQNPKTPQAQNVATGKGVNVAIVSGPIDQYNPDFIRPDGTPVITDYENFASDPRDTPGGGGGADIESFLDMSSVASQGNQVMNVNQWADNLGKRCTDIRILGMAPGASVTWLDVFGQNGTTGSNFVQAIQYADATGANVISESFGGNPNNDTGVDPIAMADAQAVTDGATVVVSSGDAGANNSLGTPSDVPNVIATGATTTFGYRTLIGLVKAQHFSGVLNNNIAAFSSSGIAQSGKKSVDVVAPGAYGFIDCTPDPILYPSCASPVTGNPSSFSIVGGTSESAPLTAGEAALVIQAYRGAHGGQTPTPGMVKRIIMSTSGDLGDPSEEQGAGLINSYRAVLAAKSWGVTPQTGDALLTSPADMTARGLPGSSQSLGFSVTNDGSRTETVTPVARVAGGSSSTHTSSVTIHPTGVALQCALDNNYGYSHFCPSDGVVKFTVPKGAARLDASVAWNVVKHPYGQVILRLVTPDNRYAGTSDPDPAGPPFTASGYGQLDISHPMAGTWQAQILVLAFCPGGAGSCSQPEVPVYDGPVTVATTTSKFAPFGSVSPQKQTLAPDESASFTLKTKLPAQAGDTNADVVVTGKNSLGAVTTAGTIPVILRTLIPVTSKGGSFSGSFRGGNGRFETFWSTTYDFNVPSGVSTLGLSIAVGDNNDNLQGVLVDPEGYDINIESTVSSIQGDPSSNTFLFPTGYRNTMQFFQVHPPAGTWRFILEVNGNVAGDRISTPFTGKIAFNTSSATVSGLPDSPQATLIGGKGTPYTIRVKNTGNTLKSFFVDPRLQSLVGYVSSGQLNLPLNRFTSSESTPQFLVPPDTAGLIFGAESLHTSKLPTLPIMFDAADVDGAPPWGLVGFGGNEPDGLSTPSFNAATSNFAAGLTMASNYQVPVGVFSAAPAAIGPYPDGEPHSIADVGVVLVTDAFDTAVHPATGDLWLDFFSGSGFYNPVVLGPGQSGTIQVRINPNQPVGSLVKGELDVDTFPAELTQNGILPYTASGDQLAAIPYEYRVG
jgi:Subtilase family